MDLARHILPRSGDRFLGKYLMLDEIGRGGMAVVYRARHLALDHDVAIKFLMPTLTGDKAAARFALEARAVAKLRTPNVVRILDADQTSEGLPFIVMEYLKGQTLSEEIKRVGSIPIATLVDWIVPVALALDEAHRAGIVHRDVKPANIFLHEEGGTRIPKLLDFGVAKAVDAKQELTTSGAVGTPTYMAPEQFLREGIGPATDIWALGAVMYRGLTGRPPFAGNSVPELGIAILQAAPESVRGHRPDVDPALEFEILRALSKRAADRHATAAEFAAAIASWGHEGKKARPGSLQASGEVSVAKLQEAEPPDSEGRTVTNTPSDFVPSRASPGRWTRRIVVALFGGAAVVALLAFGSAGKPQPTASALGVGPAVENRPAGTSPSSPMPGADAPTPRTAPVLPLADSPSSEWKLREPPAPASASSARARAKEPEKHTTKASPKSGSAGPPKPRPDEPMSAPPAFSDRNPFILPGDPVAR